ncbi:MAG: zinc ribbon domain-containing protein [bacterium]|nr:zinc ribbon domain-containing protein [bacterium]
MADLISLLTNITVLVILVSYIFLIWLGLIVWTWVDISRRSDNWFYRLAMLLLVALGAFVGFAFYLMIRPSLTKKESETQELEEQFLLASSLACPKCGQITPENFLFCIRCATSLKNKCKNCGFLVHASWSACPNCGNLQAEVPLLNVIEAQTKSVETKPLHLGVDFSGVFQVIKNMRSIAPELRKESNGETRKQVRKAKRARSKPRAKKAEVAAK